MKAILTSALGGYIKTADGRIPDTLLEANGLLDTLRFLWKADSKVMIICGIIMIKMTAYYPACVLLSP